MKAGVETPLSGISEVLFREAVTLGGDGLNCVVQVNQDEHGLRMVVFGVGSSSATVRGSVCAEAVGYAVGRAVAFMFQAEARDEDDEATAGGAR